MPEIALRTYIEQLDTLIERKQVDEVVAHCRHLLSFYPKHLDTYRMLGKALLEKGRHGDAADIFQRVLSVAPDDFIAHVGMSIVREDEANLDAAIWHMERAFEAAPANGAIQQELCRLYGRRDGVVPAKARLTRGALARMYAQGGLFLQAEAELKAALADEPDRIDLQTVLARVYAQSDQPALAAQACSGILQKLPYSLEANRILYGIFRAQDRPDDAAAYRQRVEALDPYEAFVDPNGGQARRVDANKIVLDRLEYAPGMEDSASPDWLASIGAKFEEPAARPAEAQPAWMTPSEPAPAAEAQAADSTPAASGADLPDWLRDLQPAAPGAATEPMAAPDWLQELGVTGAPPPAAADADLPDWLKTATGPLAEAAVPDWMRPALDERPAESAEETLIATPPAPSEPAGADETQTATPASMAATTPPAAPEAPATKGDDIPAWLLGAAVAAKAVMPGDETMPPAEAGDTELPEWMRSVMDATPPAAVEPATESGLAEASAPAAEAGELPEWLTAAAGTGELAPAGVAEAAPETPPAEAPIGEQPDEMASAGEAAPADAMEALASVEAATEATTPAATTEATTPDQMDTPAPRLPASTPADSEATLVGPAPAARLGDDEVPDWLRPGAAAESSGPEPDWLDALKDAGATETPTLAAAEIPDWLKPAAPLAATAAAPAEDLPDWLQTASAATGAAEMPDWMKPPAQEAAPAEAETPAHPSDDVPAWLRPAAADAIQTAPPEAETPAAAVERPADEDNVPEWLRTLPAAGTPIPPQVPDWLAGVAATAPAPDPGAKPAVELPDFLQPASPEAIARAERPFELQGEDETPAEPEGEEPPLALPAEIPGWLKGLAPVEADPAESIGAAAAARVNAAEPSAVPEQAAAESDQTLDWLASLTAQPAQAGEPLADIPPDVPSWAEPVAPGPSDTIANWLAGRSSQAELPAEPAAAAPETPPTPEASAAEAPAGELPPWAEPETPGPTDTIIGWLSAKDVMAAQQKAQAAEAPPEASAAETPATPLEQPSAEADLDGDEALRWLESLAARQGANPDELLTAPEERPAEPPAWLADEARLEAQAETPRLEAEPAEPPDWLKALEPAVGTEPPMAAELPSGEPMTAESAAEEAALTGTTVGATVGATAEAEGAPLEGDEALRWLEGLAARQGANADELLTVPEERPAEAPAWATADLTAAEAQRPEDTIAPEAWAAETAAGEAAGPAATTPPAEMPDWLKALEPAAGLEAFESLAAEPEDSLKPTPASELPDWLKALEPAAGVAAIPAVEVEPAVPPDMPADEIPDWLRPEAAGPTPGSTEPEGEAPAWLTEAGTGEGALAAAEAVRVEPEATAALEPAAEYPAASASPEAPVAEPAALEAWLSRVEAAHPVDPFADTAQHGRSEPQYAEPLIETAALAMETPAAPDARQTEMPAPVEAEATALDGDEALGWLEGLAAAQGANPDELLTRPDERPAEAPAWIVAEAPTDAAEAVAQPTPVDEMPDWLRESMPAEITSAERMAAEIATAEAATAEPAAELVEPSLAELAAPPVDELEDTGPSRVPIVPAAAPTITAETQAEAEAVELEGDEALGWLEGLAAAQGANPDELLTTPEERPTETPTWIAAAQADLTSAEAGPAGEPEDAQAEPPALEAARPEWLPAEPATEVVAPAEATIETPAEPAALDGEEALRWLEGLAAAQGANPEELLTKPEERLSEAPTWAAAEAAKVATTGLEAATASVETEAALEPEPVAEPEPVEAITPPTWLVEAAAETPAATPADEKPAEADEATPPAGVPDLDKLSRLSERLASARRARETEIEARFAEQRAQQEGARREVEQRMAAWREAMEAEPGSSAPGAGMPTPAAKTAPLRVPEPPAPAAPAVPPPATPEPAAPSAPYVRPHTAPTAAPQLPVELPDFAAALARLTPQVQTEADLGRTIHELEGLATTEQAPAPVLRLLGDAYVKANRLPRALEAYREALSRL
ncbi:MAG: hypothetical protein IT317_16700 [Anaerolineales bacterium]|nr:hypothetical protein [Anaerolineales bacterium]